MDRTGLCFPRPPQASRCVKPTPAPKRKQTYHELAQEWKAAMLRGRSRRSQSHTYHELARSRGTKSSHRAVTPRGAVAAPSRIRIVSSSPGVEKVPPCELAQSREGRGAVATLPIAKVPPCAHAEFVQVSPWACSCHSFQRQPWRSGTSWWVPFHVAEYTFFLLFLSGMPAFYKNRVHFNKKRYILCCKSACQEACQNSSVPFAVSQSWPKPP